MTAQRATQFLLYAAVLAVLVLVGTRTVRACDSYAAPPPRCPYCRSDGYMWQWTDSDCGSMLNPGLCTEVSYDYYTWTPRVQNRQTSVLDMALAALEPIVNAQGACWEWCDSWYSQGCTLYA